MSSPEEILRQYWGYDSFRPRQKEIITSIMHNRDTLALLPTGGGKSVCYQVPALMKEGFCLVISPLIALMQDQVARLKELDVPAASLHSGMHYNEVKRTIENAMHGAYKLLYISPERLQTDLFLDYLPELDISMIAVDEAHCVSQWGHDFRPDYLKIADIRTIFPDAPVLALTATATLEVQQDIAIHLKMFEGVAFRQSFARSNIFYEVRYSENKISDTAADINTTCSIIYCRSRKQTEATGRYLQQQDIATAVYHAGLPKELREEAQQQWMTDRAPVMVATTAFGMGIDKPGVRMVLHYDAPEHLEAWYQEAGRAGRDGKPSYALTLYNSADIKRLEESTALQYPPEAYLRQVYQSVAEYLQIPISAEPHQYYPFDLFDFARKFSLQPIEAMHALKLLERDGLWTLTESVYSPSTIQFITERHVIDELQDIHPSLAYVAVGLLRMYNTIFYYPTPVRETAIAWQLKLKKEELAAALAQLQAMQIIEYNKPGEGPQMFFHHRRADSRHLIIDLKRIHELRKRHEARTEAMVGFLQNTTTCREKMVLTYFGEKPDSDCGHCDICRSKQHARVNEKELRSQLLDSLATADKTLTELTGTYLGTAREMAINIIRTLMDDGIILLDENQKLKVKPPHPNS